MVQVPNLQFPGQGGQAALPPGHRPSDYPGIDYTPPIVVGNGPIVGAPGVPGARPSAPGVGIPDNFWGFVMLTMGLR
jgi:hypothetical protein